MKGSVRGATMTISLDINCEKLEAPRDGGERMHYLPCTKCGDVLALPWNTVAFTCLDCVAEPG